MPQPIFRFAPSPNGKLHLGHAYSALLNEKMAIKAGGKLLLRIEDTDQTRCKPEFTSQIIDDLNWLGIHFEPNPRMQSNHFADYQEAIEKLWRAEAVYPCFCSRKQAAETAKFTKDPDGQNHYGGTCRSLTHNQGKLNISLGRQHGWRIKADGLLAELWGDAMIAKFHIGSAYHIAVVVDDGLQGVTHVVRGKDMEQATHIHRFLQTHLGLSHPVYHHHELILDDQSQKLAKSRNSKSLADLRAQGILPQEIRKHLGF